MLIPIGVFRTFTEDLTLETKRDWTRFLLFGVVINTSAGATWGAVTLNYGNVIKTGKVADIFSAWCIGNILVVIPIVTSRRPIPYTKDPEIRTFY